MSIARITQRSANLSMLVIKRKIFAAIADHLQEKEITLITGPRQVGKTTLMKHLEEDLKKRGENTLFLDLDREQDRPFFDSQNRLIQRITYEIGKEKGYVFIDEIQRKENARLFLKGIYDMNLPYKLIVSGSGSLELKEKIHESLAGRKRAFELSTLDFDEFVDFKTEYKNITQLAPFFDLYKEIARQYFEEYLNFGGYPRVVLETEISKKQAVIDELYKSYLEKDISVLLNIQKSDSLTQLVRILAAQTGNLVNISELSNTVGIAVPTVKEYLWYLEKTFIIHKVTPFFKNIRKEITKASIYYFVDLGLKNYSLNQLGTATLIIPPQGFLFQNFVFNYLKDGLRGKFSSVTIHFWRTQDKTKVDFVINTGLEVIPVEVKYSNIKKVETTRSFKSFLSKYKPKKAFVVHLGEEYPPVDFEGTKIYFIPYYLCSVILKDIKQ